MIEPQSTEGWDDSEFEEIVLGEGNAVNGALLGDTLGGDADPDIEIKQIRLRIGRRPTIRKLRDLYSALGMEYPKHLTLFEDYEVWLFLFQLHLIKDGGFQSVRQLGCQVQYPDGYGISIVSQLPDSEFITTVGGKAKVAATMTATGEAKVPLIGAAVGSLSAKIGGEIKAEAQANAEINLSFSVMTEKVVATGGGDYVGEWMIKRSDQPLLGGQQFVHAVLVPKSQKSLNLQIRAYATVGTAFMVPARLTSDPVKLTVSLESSGAVAN